ncbi:hypothetical protein CL656_07250 [bacterium]|nr:hypothetical protein [bacterium]|tara:strand:+ start:81 stop:1484 length:1404 start_codon:yes stop_codon:yes gene_type:complete
MNSSYKSIENVIINLDKNNANSKSNSLYLYGKSGIGKTTIVKKVLQDNNIDYLYYDINNLKDRNQFNEIFYSKNGNINIMNCFERKTNKKIIYVVDNIDHIQNNEKIFLGNIIKAIRPRKKTKKDTDTNKKNKKNKNIQNLDNNVIFIGTNIYEKKIKELIKISSFYELKKEKSDYFNKIIDTTINLDINKDLVYNFCNNNYKKINLIQKIFNKCNDDPSFYKLLYKNNLLNFLLSQKQLSNYNENIIYCVNKLLFFPKNIKDKIYIHDNDKTIISLLFHENIIDYLSLPSDYTFYKNFLQNICDGDYLDRVCFQKQIWILNEMTYYLKIDKNYEEYNKLKEVNNFLTYLKENKSEKEVNKENNYSDLYNIYVNYTKNSELVENEKIEEEKILKTPSRFTKVLTKYSTEYNNNNFIIGLCKKMHVDRKRLFNLFYSNVDNESFYEKLEEYEINKLDIKRINSIIFRE